MKLYIRPMPATWWLKRWPYTLFMLREFSSFFITAYAVCFLMMLYSLSQGPAVYQAYLADLQSPLAILFHVVALAFSLLHTITWFHSSPKALDLRRGEERVPAHLIILPNYVAWVVASVVLVWIVWRG